MNWDFLTNISIKRYISLHLASIILETKTLRFIIAVFFVFCICRFNANPDNSNRNFKFIISP